MGTRLSERQSSSGSSRTTHRRSPVSGCLSFPLFVLTQAGPPTSSTRHALSFSLSLRRLRFRSAWTWHVSLLFYYAALMYALSPNAFVAHMRRVRWYTHLLRCARGVTTFGSSGCCASRRRALSAAPLVATPDRSRLACSHLVHIYRSCT
jgi:hypothetical protein